MNKWWRESKTNENNDQRHSSDFFVVYKIQKLKLGESGWLGKFGECVV